MRHVIRNGGSVILSLSEDIQDFIVNGRENTAVDMKRHKY